MAPRMEDLVAALRKWTALVPDPLKHGAFSVHTAEAVVAHVYGHYQSYWWGAHIYVSSPSPRRLLASPQVPFRVCGRHFQGEVLAS